MSDKKYSVNFATANENPSCGGGGGESGSLSRPTLTAINAAIADARSRKRQARNKAPSRARRPRFIAIGSSRVC
jgi:hypothetical protein